MLDDLRAAVRSLARARTSTAVLLLSLALGTGANAALYSVLDALLFRDPEGMANASRLASVFTSQYNGVLYGPSSYPDYQSLKAHARAFDTLAAYDDSRLESVRFGDRMERVRVVSVTRDFFTTIQLTPYAGEVLRGEGGGSAGARALISFGLWVAFGSPADIIGRPVTIGERSYVVAGIGPERFTGLQIGRVTDVWIPLDEANAGGRGERRLSIIGRLRPDTAIRAARREAEAVADTLAKTYPETNRGTRSTADEPRHMTVASYSRLDRSSRQQVILISFVVLGATGLLLLSACVNAGSLIVSRSAARRRELAVKIALGANRTLLVRQAVVESLVLSLSGAALGLVIARWTADALPVFFAPEEAGMLDTSLRWGVVAVALACSCVAGLLFSIGPVRHALQTVEIQVLRADAGAISESAGPAPIRALVVVGQVALSTVLLIAAGLMIRALTIALDGDLKMGGRGAAISLVRMPGAPLDVLRGIRYQYPAAQAVRKIPGVEAVGWVSVLPVSRGTAQVFRFETGRPGVTERLEAEVNFASGGYFAALRIPVIEGRVFNDGDGALAKPVIIVNDVLARRYLGQVQETTVGRRLLDDEGTEYEIVGVVRAGKYRTLQEAPEPMVYFALSQLHQEYMHLVARTAGDADRTLEPTGVQLRAVDNGVDVRLQMTFETHLATALTMDRLLTTIVAGCGLAAIVLATIGVYGIIADAVRRRTPEIGLRVALGASAIQIFRLVFREGLHLTLAGAATGLAAAFVLARVIRSFVHALPPLGLMSLAIAPLALAFVVVGAAILPTRRALRISPTIALKAE